MSKYACMLAKKFEDRYLRRMSKIIIDDKKDGVRCLGFVSYSAVKLFSRAMNRMPNFELVFSEELSRLRSKAHYSDFVIDGEIKGSSWSETMIAKGRGGYRERKNIKLFTFDIIPRDLWEEQGRSLPQISRREMLDDLFRKVRLSSVVHLPYTVTTNKEYISKAFESALERGEEGIMIKDADAPYQWKRSPYWLKLKEMITLDLEVREVLRGEGRHRNRMGSLYIAGYDEDGNFVSGNVGTGFSDEEREYFWRHRDSMIGIIVEVHAQSISTNLRDDALSLRMPRFVRIREDK